MDYVRPVLPWRLARQTLELGRRTRVMAILNLTPDSFYAESRLASVADVVAGAERALAEGADILDLGAESTRPGSRPLGAEEETARLLPAFQAIRARWPAALVSVDTRHPATAARALEAGADIINDVTGGEGGLPQAPCGLVLMHHRGDFATMQRLPPLADPLGCVRAGLEPVLERALRHGIDRDRVVLDPGFGFGKNLDENFPLLRGLSELLALGRPILAGVSRKSFLRRSPEQPPEARLAASLAAATAAVLAGAHLIRAHDVAPTVEAVRIADRLVRPLD